MWRNFAHGFIEGRGEGSGIIGERGGVGSGIILFLGGGIGIIWGMFFIGGRGRGVA